MMNICAVYAIFAGKPEGLVHFIKDANLKLEAKLASIFATASILLTLYVMR